MDNALSRLRTLGCPDNAILEMMRAWVNRIIEQCDDPAGLHEIYVTLGGRGFPYDEKFSEAARKHEARDALKKTLQIIDGDKP